MEEAKSESERLLQAKMLQKKMGKALLEAVGEAGENQASENSTTQKPSKKNVTFSEPVILEPIASAKEEVTSSGQADWGDIVLGRLRSSPRVPLVSTASADKYPMKVQVVERRRPNASTPTSENVADSDDEFPISPVEQSEKLGSEEDHILSRQDTDSIEGETPAEPLDEDFDFDAAQHQRDVAFEYFTKRHAIGQETARVMETCHDSEKESKYPHFTPQDTQKSTVTRFRADRMALAYDKSRPQRPCTSPGSSIVPEARQKSIRNAIRFGKLENDQLLGGPSGESGSDDDETREMTELLKRGAIQNVGPDFHTASLPSHHSSQDPSMAANQQSSRFEILQGDMGAEANLPRQTRTPPKSVISSVVERRPPLSNLQK
ncbi:hypothetical protein SCLCIDRAFT_1212530 [Scleroderma citrinum Foug A]|uniref:DUF3835 domain-containing protein n=1 Tax=Scleroderma citrinum Foug A TaxID=1036808 RepID=A0A0C3DXS0_9AGAM|nr:hypothetical protein SCLCIDRAFT_1212530 [Scleroderma citrinum Foug A]